MIIALLRCEDIINCIFKNIQMFHCSKACLLFSVQTFFFLKELTLCFQPDKSASRLIFNWISKSITLLLVQGSIFHSVHLNPPIYSANNGARIVLRSRILFCHSLVTFWVSYLLSNVKNNLFANIWKHGQQQLAGIE